MAYEIGFVDNTGTEGLAHWQMLEKIKTFAELNGWTTLRYLKPTDGTARELILKGVGYSGTEEIFIGFRTYHSVSSDYYNMSVAGFIGYVDGNAFTEQPGYIESGIPTHNLRIDYWLAVNPQRIIFGLKVGTPVYEHGYAGKFMPYARPTQYPYPMFVGGMLVGNTATRYSETTHSFPYYGNKASARMRFVDGLWKQPEAWPTNNSYLMSTNMPRDSNSNYALMPVILNDSIGVYGELDGVYRISGFNNVVENTLTIGGITYVVLQDVYRTSFNNYIALRMD